MHGRDGACVCMCLCVHVYLSLAEYDMPPKPAVLSALVDGLCIQRFDIDIDGQVETCPGVVNLEVASVDIHQKYTSCLDLTTLSCVYIIWVYL